MILDFLFASLIPQTKFGVALWGIALLVIGLAAATLVLGWVVLT